jgi:hypothetical protein
MLVVSPGTLHDAAQEWLELDLLPVQRQMPRCELREVGQLSQLHLHTARCLQDCFRQPTLTRRISAFQHAFGLVGERSEGRSELAHECVPQSVVGAPRLLCTRQQLAIVERQRNAMTELSERLEMSPAVATGRARGARQHAKEAPARNHRHHHHRLEAERTSAGDIRAAATQREHVRFGW